MRIAVITGLLFCNFVIAHPTFAADANRLTYLDEFCDPYYVGRSFAKLTTPQWIGEEGVEAVVVLAIDDMRGHQKWETYLRPILERLKQIDGRAPVSIMTCRIDPAHPHLQKWLGEGLSLEVHTVDHPCPLLQGGDFAKAKSTYDRCVDMMAKIPRSHPVAFRMPCCDSLNTPSPRFWTEIFNKTTGQGNYLAIDTSVFHVFTPKDTQLPRPLVLEEGKPRFRKYIPFPSFVNTIQDYPYPYVIARSCWEFPCMVPSDWEAQNINKPNNPITVRDMKLALDATVVKQGTFNLVFHPHGWIRNGQIVQIIDHAAKKHGKKVKFLSFREALGRLNKHLLAGEAVRAANGQDGGVRLLDINGDGYMDVVIGNDHLRQTRLWSPENRKWITGTFPVRIVHIDQKKKRQEAGVRFGILRPDGRATMLVRNEHTAAGWHFDGTKWIEDSRLLAGLQLDGQPIFTSRTGRDQGVRLRDLDGDGRCELIVGNPHQNAAFQWSEKEHRWQRLPFSLPRNTVLVDEQGRDAGLRFVDVNQDGHDDVLFSNENRYSLHLFQSMKQGWTGGATAGRRGTKGEIPMIVRAGTNNGAWLHSRHLWVQNEDTHRLPDLVNRYSFDQMLVAIGRSKARPAASGRGFTTNQQSDFPAPKSPAESLAAIQTKPGLKVELMAAEPLVMDPVNIAWGPDGKLWVVEMADYPLGIDGKGKPGGRVRFLEDTDGDGKYDRSTLFLDGIPYPTDVMPWRKGVLITSAPDVIFAQDTDGDGRADVRRTLYTGFGEGNPQHRINGLRWGLDNWIHLANGDSGGKVKSIKTGQEVSISGRDLRIRPDEGLLDPLSGKTQYGRNRDDWGNWFGCNNVNPMWHYVLADRYLRRNPHLASPDPRVNVSVTPGASRVYPISRTLLRFNTPQGTNHFTSACSPVVYRDQLFGPEYASSALICEPVHNLVHREIISSKGITFTSRRAEDEKQAEFLASRDNWFRPTAIRTGPDGALWVVDMYRLVIEHPEWISEDMQRKLDLRAGQERGRIYRVSPTGSPLRPVPRFDRLDRQGLVDMLQSPNGTQRDLAQQMLLWRADKGATEPLKQLFNSSDRPLARLHALCTLDGLGVLSPPILRRALADDHPGIRRHALRLSEPLFSSSTELQTAVLKLLDDREPRGQLQLAFSLGELHDPRAGRALGVLALRYKDDPYLSAAVFSSLDKKNIAQVLQSVLAASRSGKPPRRLVKRLLVTATALEAGDVVIRALEAIGLARKGKYEAWQIGAVAGMLQEAARQQIALEKLLDPAAQARVSRVVSQARAAATKEETKQSNRHVALRLLGYQREHLVADIEALGSLLSPVNDPDLQTAALTTLARIDHPQVPRRLLADWNTHTPRLRGQILDVLLSRDAWLTLLLTRIEKGDLSAALLDARRRQRLLDHQNQAVRGRAAKLFAAATNRSRQQVLDEYQVVTKMKGDAAGGKAVFAKRCAACHRLQDVGHPVGPDLATLTNKTPEALLIATLDPNRAIEDKFLDYSAVSDDGLVYNGILAAETGTSITLWAPEGKEQVILRSRLEMLRSSGKSLMPEGLEKELSKQDLADVIAYITDLGPSLPKTP